MCAVRNLGVMLLVSVAACTSARPPSPPGSAGASDVRNESASPTSEEATPTSAPTPMSSVDPVQFAEDPRLAACLVPETPLASFSDVLAAFELPHAADYRTHLEIGFDGPLAESTEPALVLVARSAYPPLTRHPPTTAPATVPPTPTPGFHDVCVSIQGRKEPVQLGNVADSDLFLPPASAPQAGPLARRFALLDLSLGEIAAMTWDASSHVLWLVTIRTGPTARLVRIGTDGQTASWELPGGPDLQPEPTIQAGLQVPTVPAADYFFGYASVVVDSSGAVWVAAAYGLVRFDPAREHAELRVFPEPAATQIENVRGRWLSALAADGDGVLVARNGVSSLLRVDSVLADAGSIRLPQGLTHATGLVATESGIFLATGNQVFILGRSGTLQTSVPVVAPLRALQPTLSGGAAVLPTGAVGDPGVRIEPSGQTTTLVVPMEPVSRADTDFNQNGRVLTATDWTGRTWYAERQGGGEILVVDAPPHQG